MNTVLGRYLNIDTFLHRLHPTAKLIALFVLMTITLMFQSITAYLIQIAVLILILIASRMPLSVLWKSLWSIRYLFLFILIFNVLFIRMGTPIFEWGFIKVYSETLTFSIGLVLRLLLLTSYASLLMLTTKPLDLTYAIELMLSRFGNIGHIVGMILSIALRFIPTLQEEAYKIMKAQQSRGANFSSGSLLKRSKHFVSLLIPLFVISFSRAETLAIAMELRGYDPDGTRTRYHILHWENKDTLVTVLVVAGLIGTILLKMLLKI